jgi:hypothetical protein
MTAVAEERAMAIAGDKVTISGHEVLVSHEDYPVSKVKLDPDNPRLDYIVRSALKGDRSDQKLHELLWSRDSVKELAKSIYQNGGLIVPIVMIKDGTVVEGNCRTVSYRELGKMYPHDARWRKIPAQVLPEVTRQQIDIMLAELHVAGKIPWDAYEQARTVASLHHTHGMTYDWLSAHLRMPRNKLAQLLLAYQLTSEYLKANPDPGNVKKYSFFAEVVKKRELKEKLEQDPTFKEAFFAWIRDEKLTDNKQIRQLPLILASDATRKVLDQKGFKEAYEVLVKDQPAMSSDLFASVEAATEALKAAPFDEIQDLKNGNVQKIVMLRNLHRAIQDIATVAKIQI